MAIKTFDTILSGLIASLENKPTLFKRVVEGTRIYQLLVGVSAALALIWQEIAIVNDAFFVSSSEGLALDRRVNDLGLFRGSGAKASGNLIATSGNTGTLAAGSLLRTENGKTMVEVLQTRVLVANAPTIIPVMATEVGAVHMLLAGTLLYDLAGQFRAVTFRVATNGLDNLGNPAGNLTGGADRESDETLKARFPDYLRSLSQGTLRAVRQALLGIPGVSSLVIENAKPVPGMIRISITDENGALTEDLENRVEETMLASGPSGYGYVLQQISRVSVPVTVKVYTSNQTLAPLSIQTAVTARIQEIGKTLTIGQSLYKSKIAVAADSDDFYKVDVIAPTGDTLADPSELLGIGAINVQVEYLQS